MADPPHWFLQVINGSMRDAAALHNCSEHIRHKTSFVHIHCSECSSVTKVISQNIIVTYRSQNVPGTSGP
jgi:hypothetical protein